MEELCLDAGQTLEMALHVFSPRTKTRSARSHELRVLDWGELLAYTLERGVSVTLLLNDFDPIGVADMHASVWERLRMLDKALAGLPAEVRDRMAVLVAHPGGQTGAIIRTAAWPLVRKELSGALEAFEEQGRELPPGLVELRDGRRAPMWPPARNYTQTLHQKFLVADGQRAIIGGLDIDERRFDEPSHALDADETWHDVSAEIEGEAVADLSAHFSETWDYVKANGVSHAAAYLKNNPSSVLNFELPGGGGHTSAPKPLPNSSSVVRTLPRPGTGSWRFGPRHDDVSIEQAHLDLIGNAEHYIYIESQFFRSSVIRDALTARLGTQEELRVIMLLPGAPDVVAYKGEKSAVHRYGEWLQMRALNRLTNLFPGRFLTFALTGQKDREEAHERDALYGKSMVYIHSKVLVVDDARALVSSANLNGRSMRWDVEAGILIEDAEAATALRSALWEAHLGNEEVMLDPVADPEEAVKCWARIAERRRKEGRQNAKVGPVPFPLHKTRRFAKRHGLIPENMV